MASIQELENIGWENLTAADVGTMLGTKKNGSSFASGAVFLQGKGRQTGLLAAVARCSMGQLAGREKSPSQATNQRSE